MGRAEWDQSGPGGRLGRVTPGRAEGGHNVDLATRWSLKMLDLHVALPSPGNPSEEHLILKNKLGKLEKLG